jgi:pleckstrin domain-containing family G protein 5
LNSVNLNLLLQLFLACLCHLQAANILNDVDKARLFSNIPDIYAANKHFWCQHLLPMLAQSRKTGEPLNPELLLDGFRRVRNLYKHLHSCQSSDVIPFKRFSFE